MSFEIHGFTALSTDKTHTLVGRVYLPIGEIKGYFQVVHGMAEHIARYDSFMSKMADAGWLCFGYDHLGHGKTATDDTELGFIASKGGASLLISDVNAFYEAVAKHYSKTDDQPYVLMGHSMGSFIVRLAAEKFNAADKLIVMGTGGKNPLADAGLALIGCIKLFCGKKHISQLIDSMAFGAYNKRFGGDELSDPSLWLSTDKAVRDAYYADKFCGFKFTVSAMGDLISMIKACNRDAWYKNLRRDMPVLLVSGKDDPVGNYSAGVLEVEQKLKKHSIPVSCILYDGARHELLNDFTR